MSLIFKRTADNHPLILAIESSTSWGGIALIGNGFCFWEHSFHSKLTHSRRLLSMIKQLMEQTELSWSDLDGIAVGLGPGSFTGLRISLATAKGLAMAAGIPLLGVPTLDALAAQHWGNHQTICPILDARKQEIYTAFYKGKEDGEVERLTSYKAVSPEKLIAMIREPVIFTGDGAYLYKDLLKEKLKGNALFSPPGIFYPRAAAVGNIGFSLFKREMFLDSASAVPIYVRASDAEKNTRKSCQVEIKGVGNY